MAENKQYITQEQDNGNIMISEDVIGTIVAQAIKDVEGVVGLSTKPGADIAELIGKKNWGKGIKVIVDEDNKVAIDCNVVVTYGQNVVAAAGAVQIAVYNAVDSMTGIKVSSVNVNICEIVRQ